MLGGWLGGRRGRGSPCWGDREWTQGTFLRIKLFQVSHLVVQEIWLVPLVVPHLNEAVEEQGFGEGCHLFRGTLLAKGQQLFLKNVISVS